MERSPSERSVKLRHYAPLTFWICWGYFYTNILIGLGLLATHSNFQTPNYPIIHGFATFQFWGIVFIVLALVGGIALLSNKWDMVRWVMISGLFIKSLWLYSLVFTFTIQSLAVFGMFSFLAYIQLLTVMFFPEPRNANSRR